MAYSGKVVNGVVVLDNAETLSEGTAVTVQAVDEAPTWGEVVKDPIGKAEPTVSMSYEV